LVRSIGNRRSAALEHGTRVHLDTVDLGWLGAGWRQYSEVNLLPHHWAIGGIPYLRVFGLSDSSAFKGQLIVQ
jgi:hypothetical protein